MTDQTKTPEQRLEEKRNEFAAKDPAYARYRAAMDAIAKDSAPAVEESAPVEIQRAEEPAAGQDTISMSDFVNQHRNEKLPSIQRRHQLIERQRVALGGGHRR